MHNVSLRRALVACLMLTAALALGMTGVASAKKSTSPEGEVNQQCSGPSIKGEGSTFQGPAQFLWSGYNTETLTAGSTGFNHESAAAACNGSQGSHGTPEVRYEQKAEDARGSGSCFKTIGIGIATFGEEIKGIKYPRVSTYPFCGTDEAPTAANKAEAEKFAETSELEPGETSEPQSGEAVETIPVAQGAVAVIVDLPKGCTATSEVANEKGKKESLGRLALDDETVEKIYRGVIKTWKDAVANQGGDGNDVLHCAVPSEEEDTIHVVVRKDKSGTTHIFKSWLLQIYGGKWPAEAFEKVNGTEEPCKGHSGLEAGAEKTWQEVSEGCENQRWPEEAHVIRPTASGNQGVLETVNSTESSIGYADLAVAAEKGYFDKKGEGGENKKGESSEKFWAVIQDSEPGKSPVTYSDPSTKGDTEKGAESNCKDSVYESKAGEPFPPKSTRKDWSKVKADKTSKTYGICGMTYDLAPRQFYPFLKKYGLSEAESAGIATSVHDYLLYVVSAKGGDGQKILKDSFYEGLPKEVQEEAEAGAKEIGNKRG